jgi:type IV pilus assembly protein PilZ
MGRRELFRVDAKVEVEFKSFDQFYREYSKNLSKGGIFIKSNNVLKPQTILEILLKLPGEESDFNILGEVVHVIEPEMSEAHGWEAGMGVHFIDFDQGASEALEKYVAKSYKKKPKERTPDRRSHQRIAVRLRVKFPSIDILRHDYSEDISKGGIFIQTSKPRVVGDKFIITLVHPETKQEIELSGEVMRVTKYNPQVPGNITGMAIKFIDVSKEQKKAIEEFLGLDFSMEDL